MRFFQMLTVAVLLFPVYSGAAAISKEHPRIFTDSKQLSRTWKAVNDGRNEKLVQMHNSLMEVAGLYASDSTHIVRKFDSAEKRLHSLYNAAHQISACTYAYRYSGDKRYLARVESVLKDICAYPDWNHRHFLDTANGALAVALAYDWLYYDLTDELKSKVLDCLQQYVVDAAEDPCCSHLLKKLNNWNQVCNAGVVMAAICLCDRNREKGLAAVKAAVERNHMAFDDMFAPDGIYPEGPHYMGFGNGMQIALISALKSAFGTDFNLSDAQGFSRAGEFRIFCNGPSGEVFNFSDNYSTFSDFPMMWYFADRFKDKGLLYYEMRSDNSSKSSSPSVVMTKAADILLPMYILYAAKFNCQSIPAPKKLVFAGKGIQPVAIARTGWGKEDLYLAIKGGNPANDHSHLDVGSFVFDAFGERWVSDLGRGDYAHFEKRLPYKHALWDKVAESARWKLYIYNNRQHSTLTINDRDHCVTGYAPLVEVFDSETEKGGSFDLNNAFGGLTFKVLRTAVIRDNSYLEITDDIIASEDNECNVRWNIVTKAIPEVLNDGIVLTIGDKRMKLSVEGADVNWYAQPCNPRQTDSPFASWDWCPEGYHLCGYTVKLNRSERKILTCKLKKDF